MVIFIAEVISNAIPSTSVVGGRGADWSNSYTSAHSAAGGAGAVLKITISDGVAVIK